MEMAEALLTRDKTITRRVAQEKLMMLPISTWRCTNSLYLQPGTV